MIVSFGYFLCSYIPWPYLYPIGKMEPIGTLSSEIGRLTEIQKNVKLRENGENGEVYF